MFIDNIEREEHEDARLAMMFPKIFEAKMKAKVEMKPFRDLFDLIRRLFTKKAK